MTGFLSLLLLGCALVLSSSPVQARHKGGIDAYCLPSFGEQTLVGMKCTNIKATSLLSKGGVKDGDIVTSINGKPTLSPRDMMKSIQELRSIDQAEIKIIRAGKPQSLTYTK